MNPIRTYQDNKICLLQCGRRSCSHVLLESEQEWVPSKDCDISRSAACPCCGNDDFYTLNAAGQQMTMSMTRNEGREIDPATIEPAPRMGPKMKARVLDAKRRALDTMAAVQ